MSAKSTRPQESGDNVEGHTKDHIYEGFVFESEVNHAKRSRTNEGNLTVKKRHLFVGVGILLIAVIAINVVGGYVVYKMSKCKECQPQPPTEESVETEQQTQADTIELYTTYIRWGRTTCPNVSTTVYTGYASGSQHTHSGGPSNTICLPRDPQFANSHPGSDASSLIYNSEYQGSAQTHAIFGEDMLDQDVPCAVCEVKGKSAILMMPALTECYDGWTKEYSGYLMTTFHDQHRSNLKCVDETPEKIRGQSGNTNGELFYFVEAAGTLPDPPYTRGVELTCVVCSK